MTLTTDQKDAAIALGFILSVALFIIFGNDDWTGASIGLGIFASAVGLLFLGAG